jgi:hypothetical protein
MNKLREDTIIIGHDNKIRVDFSFDDEYKELGLNEFTNIEVRIGDEIYSSTSNPENISISTEGKTLSVNIGATTALLPNIYTMNVTAFNADYVNGKVLNSPIRKILDDIKVVKDVN